MCLLLEACFFHQCLDIVLKPLKRAAQFGCTIPDPLGNQCYCFMPLVSYITDTPEACLDRHPPRTAELTLSQLHSIEGLESDIEAYFAACEPFRLSGVACPFWRDWPLTEPSHFLTPEPLHYWHRECWDHDVHWCRFALGDTELDFRFSVLPKITGVYHFRSGITKLKQVGGQTQRDVQWYLIAVIAGDIDTDIVMVVCALMEFRYLSQAPAITSQTQDRIQVALNEFHDHKQAIVDLGLHRGQKMVMDHFHIPKLELMQHVVPSIMQIGSLLQWSADTMEHAHIEVVKDPASMTNNQDYDAQIYRTLDCDEKR
ncbi:hypothetical protein OG21DRAFT_1479667 [Imleria badia]|nr:hypothetical protein OG21DRAFT_1479667 [Imleria badia]